MNTDDNNQSRQLCHDLNLGIDKFERYISKSSYVEFYLLGLILNFGPVKTPYINKIFSNKKKIKSCKLSIIAIAIILDVIAYFSNPIISFIGLFLFVALTVYSLFNTLQQVHRDFIAGGLFFRVVSAVERGTFTNTHLKNVKKDGTIQYWPRGQGLFLETAFDVRVNLLKVTDI